MSKKHKHRVEVKMHSITEMEKLYYVSEAPIAPQESSSKKKRNSKAWEYYESIRNFLPEWWEEFNGDLDKFGRLKYTTIRLFITTKTKKKLERDWLFQMLGPARKREIAEIPYFGDWEIRRRRGFGLLESPEKIKPLLKVIKENLAAVDFIKNLSPFLLEDLATFSNLERQVHEAFAGQAFLPGKAANHKDNLARFETYKTMLAACAALKARVIRELMRTQGVDPDTPQQMREIAQMAGGIGAAAALTGIAAGQQIPGYGRGIQTPNGPVIAPYTYDAIQLATHLTKHAHTFKKPLPPIIDAEVEEDSSSSSKSNGKEVQ